MGLAFATRNPTREEALALNLLLSSYRDGSGAEREKDGTTRANWRQIERCIADLYNVDTNENKNIFDLCAPDDTDDETYYGFSVKSKQLTVKEVDGLDQGRRVYMEIANSPAKFWDAIKDKLGIEEPDFTGQRYPDEIGNTIIQTVRDWHHDGKAQFEAANPGKHLDLDNSTYLCLSYSKLDARGIRHYQAHAFDLDYPANIIWRYTSSKCLSGYDPEQPDHKLIDWYALSGGQLKYYPRGVSALWRTEKFTLHVPPILSAFDKVKAYFPDEYEEVSPFFDFLED